MQHMQKKTLLLVQFSILLAIEAIICFTPLGSVPLAPPLIVATLGMIPVILAAILLGPGAGSLMGFFAGLFSFIVWTFMPPPTGVWMAFVFTPFYSLGDIHGNFGSILICFVPRILVGLVAGALYTAFAKLTKRSAGKADAAKLTDRAPDSGDVKLADNPVRRSKLVYVLGALAGGVIVTVVLFIVVYVIVSIALHIEVPAAVTWTLVLVFFVLISALLLWLFVKKIDIHHAEDFVLYGVSAIAGSMMNTIFVLGGIYLFFGMSYVQAANSIGLELNYDALMGVMGMSVITNGIPEAALAAICAYFIAGKILGRKRRALPAPAEASNNGSVNAE